MTSSSPFFPDEDPKLPSGGRSASARLVRQMKAAGCDAPPLLLLLADHPRPPEAFAALARAVKILATSQEPGPEKARRALEAADLVELEAWRPMGVGAVRLALLRTSLQLHPTVAAHRRMIDALARESTACVHEDELLPRVESKKDPAESPKLVQRLEHHWSGMIDLALAAAPEQFGDWSEDELKIVIRALRCRYALGSFPEESGALAFRMRPATKRALESYVQLGRPLWQQLHEALMQRTQQRRRLSDPHWTARAQGALWLHLKTQEGAESGTARVAAPVPETPADTPVPAAEDPPGMSLVVAPGFNPQAETGWKEERTELARYAVLARPLPLAQLPQLPEIEAMKRQLCAEFPWAHAAVAALIDDLWTRRACGSTRVGMRPTLLVGPPGCGKSRLARRLSELLKVPSLALGLGGRGDSKLLQGTTRGYAGARAGVIPQLLAERGSASALVLLDEIDKTTIDAAGDSGVAAALLQLLEPENAKRWHDGFLLTHLDLSGVMFVATANSVGQLGGALYSRLRPIVVPRPERRHLQNVAHGCADDLAEEWGLPREALPELPVFDFEGISTPRQVRALVESWLKQWAEQVRPRHRLH